MKTDNYQTDDSPVINMQYTNYPLKIVRYQIKILTNISQNSLGQENERFGSYLMQGFGFALM